MQSFFKISAASIFLLGCSITSAQLMGVPSYQLWQTQQSTQSPLELAMVEAELGRRGETKFGTSYLGQRTSANYGRNLYNRNTATGGINVDLKNCSDFSSPAVAQVYFLSAGGPVRDPNKLDADGDGLACEWGVELRKSARDAQRVRSTPRRSYSTRCYTGPRGGRYTITASGRKNYGGC